MEVSRSNGDKQKKENFDNWKVEIQEMLKQYKEDKDNDKLFDKVMKLINEDKK